MQAIIGCIGQQKYNHGHAWMEKREEIPCRLFLLIYFPFFFIFVQFLPGLQAVCPLSPPTGQLLTARIQPVGGHTCCANKNSHPDSPSKNALQFLNRKKKMQNKNWVATAILLSESVCLNMSEKSHKREIKLKICLQNIEGITFLLILSYSFF